MIETIALDDPEREDVPDEISDFGFHFPFDYLERVCWVLNQSSFTYWPAPGGLDDQDADLVDDVMLWFRLRRRLAYEYKDGEWEGPDETDKPRFNPLDRQ